MSAFAIIDDTETKFKVKDCHLNLFVLDPYPLRRQLIFEVGIRFSEWPINKPPVMLKLILPFFIREKVQIENTVRSLNSPENTRLVFREGSVTTTEEDGASKSDLKWLRTGPDKTEGTVQARLIEVLVEADETKFLNGGENGSTSIWQFMVPTTDASEIYLRMRIQISNPWRVWVWKHGFMSKNGGLFDLKANDSRNLPSAYIGNIAPIELLNCHLIVSQNFEPALTSPPPKYVRIFEGKVWNPYLKQKVKAVGHSKLVVYAWEYTDVSAKNPARAFLSLLSHPGVPSTNFFILSLVLVALVAGLSTWCIMRYFAAGSHNSFGTFDIALVESDLGTVWDWIRSFVSAHSKVIFSSAVLAGVVKAVTYIPTVRRFLAKVLRWFEGIILRVRG